MRIPSTAVVQFLDFLESLPEDRRDAFFDQQADWWMEAGFEGYLVDYRRNTTTYYQPDGDSVSLEGPPSDDTVAAAFVGEAVAAQVKWAQANPPGYSFEAFSKNVKAAGCAGYLVSFPGRRVVYFGRTAEIHVEQFPQ
jgi:uncharacterized protein YbcV (DUF1398 family)